MKKQIFILLLALFKVAGASEILSLNDCIQLALEHNPDLKKSAFQLAQSDIGLKQAWSALLPNVSASASASNSGPVVSEPSDSWSRSLGGTVQQSIYAPGLYSRIDLAGRQKQFSHYGLLSQKNQVRAAVEKIYYQILISDTLIDVYEANIGLADEQIFKMRQMVDLGLKRASDLLKSEVQRGTFEAQLVRETESLTSSKRSLNLLMGRDPDIKFEVIPIAVDQIDVPEFETAAVMMLNKNPALKQMKLQVRMEQLSLRISKEAFLPSLSGSYSYSNRQDARTGGTTVENDQLSLNVSVDLFNRFNKLRDVQLNRLALQEVELDCQTTLRDMQDALLSLYKALETQNRLIRIHQTNLESARQDLKIVSEQYASGLSSILDLTDAQVSAFESETSLMEDFYTRKRIEAEIRQLIGYQRE